MSNKGRRANYLIDANYTSTYKGSPYIVSTNTEIECSMVTQPSALVNTLNAYVEQNDKILSRGAFYYYYAGAGIGRGDFAETRETVA